MTAHGSELTYSEVGATAGVLPAGYHHVDRSRIIASGPHWFEAASERLLGWEMHRRAGLHVEVDEARVTLGADALLRIRLGPWWVRAPVRVVDIIDEPSARGFAYGTLPGHPESGEERFCVRQLPNGRIQAEIRAFSRPARWFSRLGGPVSRATQRRMTERYLGALA